MLTRVAEKARLRPCPRCLAHMDGASPVYWDLVFHDPELTASAPVEAPDVAVDYD